MGRHFSFFPFIFLPFYIFTFIYFFWSKTKRAAVLAAARLKK